MGDWFSRGYLPHFNSLGTIQTITFRLADSLPQQKLWSLKQKISSAEDVSQQMRQEIESWLDAGIGCCALKHPEVAQVVQDALLHFDGKRYRLLKWCIMPNHVHVIIEQNTNLSKIVQSWKSYTGKWALANNSRLKLGIPNEHFWMRDYWDRFIRSGEHYWAVADYIENNPVHAGLCENAKEWRWSSAGRD